MPFPHRGAAHAARIVVIGGALVVLGWALLSPLAHHLAVIFCGVLLALAVANGATFLHRRARVPYRVGVVLIAISILAGGAGLAAWTGPRLARELVALGDAVPAGIEAGRELLARSEMGRAIEHRIEGAMPDMGASGPVGRWVSRGMASGLGAIADLGIVLFLGFFLAASPGRYVEGALLLVPRARRARIAEVVHETARALRAWIAARMILMVVLGTAFGLALWALGVPLALPIGVLTGLTSFIPYVGAVIAVVPAALVALTQSPELALQVLAVYLVIQLIETNVVDPLVEAHAVRIPPALIAIAQIASAVWFGPIGILIATPLLVIVVIATRMLYVEDRLGEPAPAARSSGGGLRSLGSKDTPSRTAIDAPAPAE